MNFRNTSFTTLNLLVVAAAFVAGTILPLQRSYAAGPQQRLSISVNESSIAPFSAGTTVNYIEVNKTDRSNCLYLWGSTCQHLNSILQNINRAHLNIWGTAGEHTAMVAASWMSTNRPVSIRFAMYGDITRSDEVRRLNKFSRALYSDEGAQGYILTYGGRNSMPDAAQERADRAKEYLITSRDHDPGRLVTVDGGYKEAPLTDLWIVPSGATPPTASPTVDASEVEPQARK